MVETLFLVRHSKAVAAHPDGDRYRALSPEGRLRVEEMLPRARGHDFHAELALSSPYLRAVQTRDLFASVLNPSRSETSTVFTPESEPDDALDELKAWEKDGFRRIALFTHNPFVSLLAALLLPADAAEPAFHTPTILALSFEKELAPHAGRVLWTLNP